MNDLNAGAIVAFLFSGKPCAGTMRAVKRMRSGVLALTAFALVLIALTTALAVSAATANTWSGTWHTSWTGGTNGGADMVLTQTGDNVSGTYDHLTGTINGTVSGYTLSGSWTQSNDHGTVTFTLVPTGASWSGTWTSSGGGGSWTGNCMAGNCLANTTVVTAPSTTASPAAGQRPSATVVQCDRDVATTTDAKFQCTARVADAGVAPTPAPPTGTITWAASVGALSATSCTLTTPDLGAPSCTVEYDASNEAIPGQIAVPKLTASYSGDSVYAASRGAPTLGVPTSNAGGSSSGGSISPLVPAAGVVAAIAAALAALAHLKGAGGGADGSNLVDPGVGGPGTGGPNDPAIQHKQADITAQQQKVLQDLQNAINADPSGVQQALQQHQTDITAQQQKILQDVQNAINADPSGVQQALQQRLGDITAQQQKILQDLIDTMTQAPTAPPPRTGFDGIPTE